MTRIILIAAATILGSTSAFAEPLAATATTTPYHNAVSVQLATLDTTAVALQGEHDLGRKQLSLAVALGIRSAARGEYDSLTYGAGVELRRWVHPMHGWYVGGRTDLARTSLDDGMRTIGGLTTWSLGVTAGYRVVWHRIELTPSAGLDVVFEGGMNGRSPTTMRGAAVLGLTAGVVF
jgi:hypothetical protein